MRFANAFSLHNGAEEWKRRELDEWLTDLFEAPAIPIAQGCTTQIRSHLRDELSHAGWSNNVRIDQNFDLTVTGMYRDLAFQVQTGNISRAIYDLLKLQYLYAQKKINCAALAVPTKEAADVMSSNVASFERIRSELGLFDRIIIVPLMVVSFE